MKTSKKILLIIATLVLSLSMCFAMIGCGDKTYKVTFDSNGGSAVASVNVFKKEKVNKPEDPTKAGYNFNGWYLDGELYSFDNVIVENITLTAGWTAIDYTVIFRNYQDTADLSKKEDYHYGDTVTIPNHSENLEGYSYGWDKEVVAVTGNVTYIETKTPNVYNVTLNANGGVVEGALTSYTYATGATLPSEVTKTGYTFAGWYLEEDFSGNPVTEILATDLGDKVFYAKYTANVYNVTLNVNGGELASELTSYTYATGATLPVCEKLGYDFVGWYLEEDFSGDAVATISTTDLGDKVFYANYTARKDTKYTVQVLVPKYVGSYMEYGWYDPQNLTYVDKTSDYATLLNLDSNNQGQGETDTTIDLTSTLSTLKGAKVNETSVLSGVIASDGSLNLTVKLDFNVQDLGFDVNNIQLGRYNCENIVYTLEYRYGVCGLAITGTFGNGADLRLDVTDINVQNYSSIKLNYYQKSTTWNNRAFVVDETGYGDTARDANTLNHEEYPMFSYDELADGFKKANLELLSYVKETSTTIDKVFVKLSSKESKEIFITGIETKLFKKETVTYSVDNDNIAGIATSLFAGGEFGSESDFYFANESQNMAMYANAFKFTYSGAEVTGLIKSGISFDLGGIKVSDYKTIKIVFAKNVTATEVPSGNVGLGAYLNKNTEVSNSFHYSELAAYEVDLKVGAEATGVKIINTVELAFAYWAKVTDCTIRVAYIQLELADTLAE